MGLLGSSKGAGFTQSGPSYRSILGSWKLVGSREYATLTTAIAGTNNDLTYTAKIAGSAANAITVRYVVSGANTPLSVSVSSNAITVNVATNGSSVATSTAAQVKAAVDASTPAAALVSTALATGNDGTGVVAALSATNLAGGTDFVLGAGNTGTSFLARPYK